MAAGHRWQPILLTHGDERLKVLGMAARTALTVGVALLIAACTSGTGPNPAQRGTAATSPAAATPPASAQAAATSSVGTLGAPGCRPPSPIGDLGGFHQEVRGTTIKGELWGLLFEEAPYRVGDEVKIAWRMTGNGDIRLSTTAPDGTRAPPAWGPEAHTGSNYDRPGDEWGAGYRFTQAGCWTLHAARDDTTADVWLIVG